jgi:dienelactone hydrolase
MGCSSESARATRAKEQAMKTNVGRIDRGLRVLVAAGAVAGSGVLGFSTAGGIVLLVVAAVMVATAASGFCPLYALMGIRTTRAGEAKPAGHRPVRLHRAA